MCWFFTSKKWTASDVLKDGFTIDNNRKWVAALEHLTNDTEMSPHANSAKISLYQKLDRYINRKLIKQGFYTKAPYNSPIEHFVGFNSDPKHSNEAHDIRVYNTTLPNYTAIFRWANSKEALFTQFSDEAQKFELFMS